MKRPEELKKSQKLQIWPQKSQTGNAGPDSLTAPLSRKKAITKLRNWNVNQLTWKVGRVLRTGAKVQGQRIIQFRK